MGIVYSFQLEHGAKIMDSLIFNGDRKSFVISPSLRDSFYFWYQALRSIGKVLKKIVMNESDDFISLFEQ